MEEPNRSSLSSQPPAPTYRISGFYFRVGERSEAPAADLSALLKAMQSQGLPVVSVACLRRYDRAMQEMCAEGRGCRCGGCSFCGIAKAFSHGLALASQIQ